MGFCFGDLEGMGFCFGDLEGMVSVTVAFPEDSDFKKNLNLGSQGPLAGSRDRAFSIFKRQSFNHGLGWEHVLDTCATGEDPVQISVSKQCRP